MPDRAVDEPARRRLDPLGAALLAGGALALYVATLAPGLAFQGGDGHELTMAAATLGLAHPTGYPLFTWLGFAFTRLVPIGEIAYRTNLMSAVLGAAAVGVLYLVGRRLALPPIAAGVAAAAFATSSTFWSQAVITEVYAPNALMVALTLWCLLRWADAPRGAVGPFARFALVYGLSLGTHLSNLGLAPAYLLFVFVTDPPIVTRPRTILLGVAAFALGAAQFVWLPLRAGAQDLFPNPSPDTLARFYAYTLGAFADQRFAYPLAALPSRASMYAGVLRENFGWPGIALAVLGACALLRRAPRRFWLLAGMYLVHVTFFTQLFVLDPDVFFIPSHLVVALLVGFGIDALWRAGAPAFAGRTRPMAAIGALVLVVALLGARARASFHDDDRSGDTVVGDFVESLFAVLPPGSVLLSDRGAFGASIAYARRLGRVRPDVFLPSERDAPPPPRDAPLYATRADPTAGGLPRDTVPPGAAFTPVLRSVRHELLLYRVDLTPPPPPREPAVRLDRALGNAILVGAEVVATRRAAPARIRFRTAWRVHGDSALIVTTGVDDMPIESHTPARGDGGDVVEDVEIALPRGLEPGRHTAKVGTVELTTTGVHVRWAPVGAFEVE